jgi:Domain of unknown function (DUF4177)
MKYTYKVVPFMGKANANGQVDQVSRQLEKIINDEAAAGWEFHQLGRCDIEVKLGCLAGLLGAKTAFVSWDQVIFHKGL